MKTPKAKKALALRAQGKTFLEIAGELGVSSQEAIDLIQPLREEAQTLASVETEQFVKAHKMDKRGRLERLAELQDRLFKELQERSFADASTDKLCAVFLKTSDIIRKELEDSPPFLTVEEQEDARQKRTDPFYMPKFS